MIFDDLTSIDDFFDNTVGSVSYNYNSYSGDIPYKYIEGDKKSTLIYLIPGLTKDDIKVSLIEPYPTLSIKTSKKDEYFQQNKEFITTLPKQTYKKIKSIEWKVKDGVLYIFIYKESEKLKNIDIKYTDDAE